MKGLILGCNGQLGSTILDDWIDKGYEVTGTVRRSSTNNFERISHNLGRFSLVEMDITDAGAVSGVFSEKPDIIINTIAQSHVGTSFKNRKYTAEANYIGVINCLDSLVYISPSSKFITCSTSEMFGSQFDVDKNGNKYQNEETLKIANSPYGVSKIASHNEVDLARRFNGVWASCAINFNFEGPRRGELFVTKKITKYIGELKKWFQENDMIFEHGHIGPYENLDNDYIYSGLGNIVKFPKLRLGNCEAVRDWQHCKDVVRGINLIFERKKPDDYVFCTGKGRTINDFLKLAFEYSGLGDYKKYIVIDPKFYRPVEVPYLQGRYDKAKKVLGWTPKISFEELVKEMVDYDIRNA